MPRSELLLEAAGVVAVVSALLGMAWGIAGGGLTKRIAIAVVVVLAAFALLPYGLDTMGMDVRALLVANLPALGVGWAIARYTPLGTPRWITIAGVVVFLATLVLLRGLPGVPAFSQCRYSTGAD